MRKNIIAKRRDHFNDSCFCTKKELRTVTNLRLAEIVLEECINNQTNSDLMEFVPSLAACRAEELIKEIKAIPYITNEEAFTCEVANEEIYVIKHKSLREAILYAHNSIAEIFIVYNENIVVTTTKTSLDGLKQKIYWGYAKIPGMHRLENEDIYESEEANKFDMCRIAAV